MLITSRRSAAWEVGIKDDKGKRPTQSGALQVHPCGFTNRFEGKAAAIAKG